MQYGILEQISMVFKSENRFINWLSAFIVKWFPTFIGGFVPFATFSVNHYGKDIPGYQIGIFAGLTYSALTVFKWLVKALKTQDAGLWETRLKAAGFVGLLETFMIICTGNVLFVAYMALGILIFVNGVATGCNLMLESAEKKAIRERAEQVEENRIRQNILNEIEEQKRNERERRARNKKAKINKKAA